jgi:hypothetical protein
MRPNSIAAVAALTLAFALAAGCARKGQDESVSASAAPPRTDAVATYGYGPKPNPRVTYQPDVVLMSGGPEIIRSVSKDGLTWTIDGDAKEARDLAPGRIMFASSRAVGRIVDIERRGDDLAISVVPVRLTEVVRNANLRVEQRLSSPVVAHYEVPPEDIYASAPPPESDPGAGRFLPVGTTTETSSYSGKFLETYGFEVEPFIKSADKTGDDKTESVREIGVKIARRVGGSSMKVSTTVSLYGRDIRIRANLVIVDGKMQDASSFLIEGVEGLDVGFVSGSGDASTLKLRLRDALIDTGLNTMADGIPLAITFKAKVYMELAFSSGNSTLSAQGGYKVSGPIGFDRGAVQKPTITLRKSLLQSVEGATPGPAGVVTAVEFRLLLGVGNKDVAVAGGYGKLIVSIGVSQGSAYGLPLAQCRGVTFKVDAGTGFGLEFNKGVFGMLEQMNPKLRPRLAEMEQAWGQSKIEVELGKEFGIVNVSAVNPNIRLCGGGGA